MKAKYYLAVMAAFFIYGLMSLPLKALDQYAAIDILLSRVFFSSVLIILFSLAFRKKVNRETLRLFRSFDARTKKRLWVVNIASSVALAVNWYLFIYVMNNISVNATSLAYMICPIITTVLAYFFLKDQLTRLQWLAVLLSLVSCVLLTLGNYLDFLYSFMVGLSYAVYLVLQKKNNQLDRFFTLAFQLTVAILLLSPLYSVTHATPVKAEFYFGVIFIIAALFTIIPMYLNVYALDGLTSSTAGIFIYLNPILSFVLALSYFEEKMSLLKIVAYSIVFFSVVLFNLETLSKLFHKRSRRPAFQQHRSPRE